MSWEEDSETPRIRPKDAPRSLDHSERVRIFGQFAWKSAPTDTNKEAVWRDPQWERENLVKLEIPWSRSANHRGIQTRCHKLAHKAFVDLWEAWKQAGLLPNIVTFNGLDVPRLKRGKAGLKRPQDLSNHSWATAMDVNAPYNPMGRKGAKLGQTGHIHPDMVTIAAELGFAWGGYFSTYDDQHFELVRLAAAAAPLPTGV